jgi:aspartate aminotransferase
MIKNIVKDLKPSATLRINEESKKLETQGTKIFKFGFGQSPFQIPKDIVDELKNNAYQNKYLPMQGLPALRSSTSRYINNKKK